MRKKGQATVEFALVIAVAIVLAVGAVQLLHFFYLTREVRAAAEEAANVASIHGGDLAAVEEILPAILSQHRLSRDLTEVTIEPAQARYLELFTLTLTYNVKIRLYGLFDLPVPIQRVSRLSEGG